MARLTRVSPIGVTQHIIQRGINGQEIFTNDADRSAYLGWIKEYSLTYKIEVHAWILMTNHVHLLCTPQVKGATSKMMQSIGRMYVRYFNSNYQRTGTLWEGRFRSCLVDSESYLLALYKYIELNPVRAGLVDDPADYSWSSYQCNALGIATKLQTPHSQYRRLGQSKKARLASYRALFKVDIDKKLLNEIRANTNRGLALGSRDFAQKIEQLTCSRVTKKKRGRPVKK